MKILKFFPKSKFSYRLSTMSFSNLYDTTNIILFISEKALLFRLLFRLRHEGLYKLNVESCRVILGSGSYISFHFKTWIQVLKFVELNYSFNNFLGLILINKNFLNCSFIQLKHILLSNISSIFILKFLWSSIWLSIIWSIFFILFIIQSVLNNFKIAE